MEGNLLDQLVRCVERDDIAGLQELRNRCSGSLISHVLKERRLDGITVLHLAALRGRLECMQELLAMKAEVDVRARRAAFRETPLHMAASKGFVACVELLVRSGADINAGSITDQTPYNLAVYHRQRECAEFLVQEKEINEERGRKIRMQQLAMFEACASGDLSWLQSLLDDNPSFLSCLDKDGYNLIQKACQCSHFDMVRFLADRGCSVTCVHEPSGDTLLHMIARSSRYAPGAALARHLLSQEPSLAASVNKDRALPLHLACETGNLALTTVLLRFQEQIMQLVKTCYCPDLGGSSSDVNAFSFEFLSQTIEYWLSSDSLGKEVRKEYDIDATLAWKTKYCPCSFATAPARNSLNQDIETAAEECHGCMFPVNSGRLSDGNTPFHLAVIGDCQSIVKQLLVYGGYEGEDGIDPRSPAVSFHEHHEHRPLRDCKLFNSQYACVKLTTDNMRGYQPLHEAIVHGRVGITFTLGAASEEDLFNSPFTKFKVEHHELKRPLTLLEMAVASKHLDMLSMLLVQYDASESMDAALQVAGELNFTSGASLLLAKKVHDSCAKFFREQLSRDGLQAVEKVKENVGQITWEQIGLKALDTDYLKLASWVVGRFLRCAEGFLEHIARMAHQPSQQELDSMLATVFQRSGNSALTSFRSALVAPPSLNSNLITVLNLAGNQLNTVPMAVFQLPQLRVLMLSGNEITVLPAPTGRSLHFSEETDMTDFSPESIVSFALSPASEEYNCRELAQIELQHNKLTSVPGSLFKLEGLEMLDLSHNLLTQLPFEMWTSEKLRSLRANDNQLKRLPSHPTSNSRLSAVDESGSHTGLMANRQMSRHGVAHRSSYLAENRDATTVTGGMRGGAVDAVSLPDDADFTHALKKLSLVNNQLKSLPSNLCCLAPNLEELDVNSNKLTTINMLALPARILVLRAMKNNLSELKNEPASGTCSWSLLVSTSGMGNEADGGDSSGSGGKGRGGAMAMQCEHVLGFLPNLSTLRLSSNRLSQLTLTASSDSIVRKGDVDEESAGDDVRPVPVGTTTAAGRSSGSSGYMSGSAAAGEGLQEGSLLLMPSLTFLYLDHNCFEKVPKDLPHCSALNVLYLGHNQIDELPEDLGNLTHLYQLNVDCLQLKNMHAAVLDRGNKAIISYLRGIKENAVEHRRMKLMVVGRHGQGKTTLVKALRDGAPVSRSKHKPVSTDGVDVQCWCSVTRSTKPFQKAPPPINFCVWDFGGQEEYYATHQCFLSRRSLYLAVWNMQSGMAGICELQPWLVNIQARAPGSTVIIVGTHLDRVVQDLSKQQVVDLKVEVRRRYVVDESGAKVCRPGMPNVVAAMEISNMKGSTVKELRDLVYNTASEIRVHTPGQDPERSPRMIDQKIPESYRVLEEAVRLAATGLVEEGRIPVLSSADYMDTMRRFSKSKEKLPRAEEINAATSFLHDYGVLLHYEEPALHDLYFVSPKWLCHTLSRVIAVKEINNFAKKGVMLVSNLQFLFDRSNASSHIFNQCISLMERFEIALRISETNLLIPSMLPQRYEEGQRTGDFGGRLALPDDPEESPLAQSSQSSACDMAMPPLSQSSHNQAAALASHKLSRTTRRQLEEFRQRQLQQNASTRLLSPRTDKPSSIEECDFLPGEDFSRIYITPYPPTGFWPRLISRMLGDKMMSCMVVENFPALPEGVSALDLVDCVCWRSGIELHLASCPVMRVSRLNDTMTSAAKCNAQVYCSGSWHSLGAIGHCGVEVFVDVYALREVLHILHDDEGQPRPAVRPRSSKMLHKGASRATTGGQQLLESRVARRKQLVASQSFAGADSPSALQLQQRRSQFALGTLERSETTVADSPDHTDFTLIGESDPLDSLRGFSQLASNAAAEAVKEPKERKKERETPAHRGTRLAVWLLARVVSHIDSLLFDWYGGLHSNEGYSAINDRPSIIRVVPCPRCVVEVRRMMSMSCEAADVDGDQPEVAFDMATGLAARIFQAATNPAGLSRSAGDRQPVRLQSDEDEDDTEMVEDVPLSCFSLCDIALQANSDVPVSDCELECKRHGSVSVLRLAPDMFFADLPLEKVLTAADYIQCTTLDKGGFGEVYNGKLFKTKSGHPHPVAIKTFEISKDEVVVDESVQLRQSLKLYTSARAEIGILASLRHDNIVELLGVNRKPLRMLMARAPCGNLKSWLAKYRTKTVRLPPGVLHACLNQTAAALEYLHDNQIIYRDLKPANTLVWSFPSPLDADSSSPETVPVCLRLADYGISQFCSPSGIKGLKDGTRVYMAPEVVQFGGKETFNEKVDVYAYGANMYELLTLNPPYANDTMLAVAEKIRRGHLLLPKKARRRFYQVQQLMRWCLRKEPHERPSFKQVCHVLAADSFLRLIDKVRITDSSTVTAGAGQMPCPASVGNISLGSSQGASPGSLRISTLGPTGPAGPAGDWTMNDVQDSGPDRGDSSTGDMLGGLGRDESIAGAGAAAAVSVAAATVADDDVQCEGCMSTVWLGDGNGCVSVVDYRRGRSLKPPTVKICRSHITGLLSVDNKVWIASELDGLFLYNTSLRRCYAKWTGQGLPGNAAGDTVVERRMTLSRIEEQSSKGSGAVGVAASNEDTGAAGTDEWGTGGDLSISSQPCGERKRRFRTVCILAVPSRGLVLVVHSDGSLAVFASSVSDMGVSEFAPRKNHPSQEDREVCCMALVRPAPGVEEVWMGLYSGKVLVANVSQLLSDDLLASIGESRLIDVLGECPEYKVNRRIRLLTTMSASMATAGVNSAGGSASSSASAGESQSALDSPDLAVDREVWLAMDRMSVASCWSTSTRQLMKPCGFLDCQNDAIVPRLPGISSLQYERETRVTAVLPLTDKVVVGTGGGHIIVVALETLQPLCRFAAYRGPVMCLLPYTFPATGRRRAREIRRESAGYFSVKRSNAPANDLEGQELVLSCGQACHGLPAGPGYDDTIKASHIGASESLTEGYLLMWLIDE